MYCAEGSNVRVEGISEGIFEGISVVSATDVGTIEGSSVSMGTDVDTDVGTNVSVSMGEDVGISVDTDVGTNVRVSMGTDVGSNVVGIFEGITKGSNTGACVSIGLGVGDQPSSRIEFDKCPTDLDT